EPEVPDKAANTVASDKSVLPTRKDNIARVDEVQPVPKDISTVQNTQRARPDSGRFNISSGPETDGIGPYRPDGRGRSDTGTSLGSQLTDNSVAVAVPSKPDVPPPTRPNKPRPPKSLGVVTGMATHLPKPFYPPGLKAMHI